jgi:hypothetical protein
VVGGAGVYFCLLILLFRGGFGRVKPPLSDDRGFYFPPITSLAMVASCIFDVPS